MSSRICPSVPPCCRLGMKKNIFVRAMRASRQTNSIPRQRRPERRLTGAATLANACAANGNHAAAAGEDLAAPLWDLDLHSGRGPDLRARRRRFQFRALLLFDLAAAPGDGVRERMARAAARG